jgi:hypothetical protein
LTGDAAGPEGGRLKILLLELILGLCVFQKWPSGSSNGYAYYHRVDQVNGGDQNATHTTGFGKKIDFWYE